MTVWSDLNQDLLVAVLRRLPFADAVRSAAVCSTWRAAARSILHRSNPRPPHLMLPSPTSPVSASLLDLSDLSLRTLRFPNPPVGDRLWFGSSAGWLITADTTSELILINPITLTQRCLPPIATLPHISPIHEPDARISGYRHARKILAPDAVRFHLFEKAVVSVDEEDGNAMTVMLILDWSPTLVFARVGDTAWTPVRTEIAVHDVNFLRGRFHSVDARGKVSAWDLTGAFPEPQGAFPDLAPQGSFVDKYLLESAGKLLQAWRVTGGFRVFELAAATEEWVELTSIGDLALFLGNNCSVALSSKEFPELKGNSIYFTETYGFFQFEGCGNWIFSLDDKSAKPCYALGSGTDWPLPIWIMPCLE